MRIDIKATNLELTAETERYLEEKMAMVEKYLGSVTATACRVELARTTQHHQKGEIFKAEINLDVPGQLLRVEKVEDDLFKAIDNAKDHLVEIIKKHKGKRLAKRRTGVREE